MTAHGTATTRRGFLKKGLLGGALLAAGGVGFLAFRGSRKVALPKEPLQVLDAVQYAVVQAIAARLLPERVGWPTVEELEVALAVDRVLRLQDPTVRKEVKQLLGLFENALANFAFGRRVQPFTRLSAEAQDEVLREWQTSSLTLRRTGFQGLRTLLLGVYHASPRSWTAMRYPGPPKGMHQPLAPVWKGGGAPRPPSNGTAPREGVK
ncbi:MAG: gluconate 2-dehydrogenase subunit 3 family protein [Deltaproteobacteria bacterium]|nr:gluconate 2-dehydrogenase subunit 3 family protein [Deltaproteobacteria bacterium]